MSTFVEANQAKLSLKMTLSNYAWYNGMSIAPDNDDWCIVVSITQMDNSVRKVIPIVHKGITVKVDADQQIKKK